jgi:hypothetical protein
VVAFKQAINSKSLTTYVISQIILVKIIIPKHLRAIINNKSRFINVFFLE